MQLFDGVHIKPAITNVGKLKKFSAEGLDVFAGDIFDLTKASIGPVHAVFDRAALVALPLEMRKAYTRHLIDITSAAPQLNITFEYDQSVLPGPPFSISEAELQQHYASAYDFKVLASQDLAGGLKGKVSTVENVRVLTPKRR